MPLAINHLGPGDVRLMEGVNTLFGEAFDDPENYTAARPGAAYLSSLLGDGTFVALAALDEGQVIGGLVAYEFRKFEQQRSEYYIYDLAVLEPYRRQGIARALIAHLQRIAAERGVYVIIVQADTEIEDQPAIALYTTLGARTEVLSFDIPVPTGDGASG